MSDEPDEPEAWFSVFVSDMKVAGGSGPESRIKAEAAHYALMYADDGFVRVICRRYPQRKRRPA